MGAYTDVSQMSSHDIPATPDDDGDIFDDFPIDQHSCRLLGKTALIVQGFLGLLVVLSLVGYCHVTAAAVRLGS